MEGTMGTEEVVIAARIERRCAGVCVGSGGGDDPTPSEGSM